MLLVDLTDISKVIHIITPFITILSVVVEVAPIKINPWTVIFKYIGGIINRGVYKKLDAIELATQRNAQSIEDIKAEMESRFNTYDKQDKEQQAVSMRNEIINFAENLKLGRIYSEKQFEYILDVISKYYIHCDTYKIKNHYIDEAHDFIRTEARNQFEEIKKGHRNE
nr:MAG TPA: hypothetical protein [Caudoviricetes sp.]